LSLSIVPISQPSRDYVSFLSVLLQLLDSEAMNESGLNKYLDGMENGEWGDGIVLSAAVRLYNRPIVIVTPDGRADD